MIETIYLLLGIYTMQAYNLVLTYLQCFVCLAFLPGEWSVAVGFFCV